MRRKKFKDRLKIARLIVGIMKVLVDIFRDLF